jgi:hypothetical protein
MAKAAAVPTRPQPAFGLDFSKLQRLGMGKRRQRPWNALAMVAVVLAAILAMFGIGRIDVSPVLSRDSLRLSSAFRALASRPLGEKPALGGWSAMRGDQLNAGEERVDRAEFERAPYKVEV